MSEYIRCFFLTKDPRLIGRMIRILRAQVGTHDTARAGLAGVSELAGELDGPKIGYRRSLDRRRQCLLFVVWRIHEGLCDRLKVFMRKRPQVLAGAQLPD